MNREQSSIIGHQTINQINDCNSRSTSIQIYCSPALTHQKLAMFLLLCFWVDGGIHLDLVEVPFDAPTCRLAAMSVPPLQSTLTT